MGGGAGGGARHGGDARGDGAHGGGLPAAGPVLHGPARPVPAAPAVRVYSVYVYVGGFDSGSAPSLVLYTPNLPSHPYGHTIPRFDVPSGTLALLTSALGSGCWPRLESLDVSLDLLALDAFAGPALLQEGWVGVTYRRCLDIHYIHTYIHIIP